MESLKDQLSAIKKLISSEKNNTEVKLAKVKKPLVECKICNAKVKNINKHNVKAHPSETYQNSNKYLNKLRKALFKKLAKEERKRENIKPIDFSSSEISNAYNPPKVEIKTNGKNIQVHNRKPSFFQSTRSVNIKIEMCQHCGKPAMPGDSVCKQCSSE